MAVSTGPQRRLTDDLFRQLDGRIIALESKCWSILVYAIASAEGQQWVQLALFGCPTYTTTIRIPIPNDKASACDAIVEWLTNEEDLIGPTGTEAERANRYAATTFRPA
jgi:hypothetical protein